ncbi:hypothetical protein QFC19_000032 [Naganishia cerealis]|uniref:Uncharacterized protein n=1 Tax=Naganishia cerealis TaxID=610337 RepID=A0ACC2WRM9_9TREE|nr:hypothetical protein QFC19_000032 [Naganishia cerealis]
MSCLPIKGHRMDDMLPPPRRPRSRSTLQPRDPDHDEISYLAEFSLNVSNSPTSIDSNMNALSTTTSVSPMSNDNKGMSALPRVPSMVISRRGSLHLQRSNSSLAEPRLANVEVTSRWSTEALHPRHATRELSNLREGCISTAVDKPVNPFLSGFREEHLQRSKSASKHQGVRPSPLHATHQRHVSAPMVSSRVANFIIPPPQGVRLRGQESPHRKATTCLSRQPSRLEMRGRDSNGSASPIMQPRKLSTASTDKHTEGEPAGTKVEQPSLSRMFSRSWSQNFLDSHFLPKGGSRHIVSTTKQNSDGKEQGEQDFFNVARTEEEEDGEDETEVFLGLDDI